MESNRVYKLKSGLGSAMVNFYIILGGGFWRIIYCISMVLFV